MPSPIEDAHRSSWPHRNECFVAQEDKDVRCGRTPEVRDARRRGYRAARHVEKGRLTLLILAPQIVTLVFPNTSVTIWGAEMVGNGTSRRRRQSRQGHALIGGTDAPQSTPLYEARCPQAPVHRV